MSFIPDRGDIIWVNFTPQAGHEQRGVRPALVISPKIYNKISLALCCPLTSNQKGYPFEVVVKGKKIQGVVLTDHVKSLDWKAREAKFIEKASAQVMEECQKKLLTLIE